MLEKTPARIEVRNVQNFAVNDYIDVLDNVDSFNICDYTHTHIFRFSNNFVSNDFTLFFRYVQMLNGLFTNTTLALLIMSLIIMSVEGIQVKIRRTFAIV